MKDKIHPEMKKAQVRCACGNTFETLSTKGEDHGGNMREVPPDLYGTREAPGFRGKGGKVREKVRQEGGKG